MKFDVGNIMGVSTMVMYLLEGTFFPITASSPDTVIRSILAAGLEKQKSKSRNANRSKVLDRYKLATYLLLVACMEL